MSERETETENMCSERKGVGGCRKYQIGKFEIAICKRGRMGGKKTDHTQTNNTAKKNNVNHHKCVIGCVGLQIVACLNENKKQECGRKETRKKIISRQAEREVNLAGEIKCAALPQDTDCV